MFALVLVALGVALAVRPSLAIFRFVRMPSTARRNWPAAVWARMRWRWLSRNAGLSYIDQHHRRTLRPRVPGTTAVRVHPVPVHKLRFPAAHFRADEFGFTVRARTVPRVGRAEFEKASQFLADGWGCARVRISQPRPGRLELRALRRDPLLEPLPMAAAPAGVFDRTGQPERLYLGRDLWGEHRHFRLANLPAVLVSGVTGYGKTTLITGWLAELLATPHARLRALIDFKGSWDFAPWEPLARVVVGDDLAAAAEALAGVHSDLTDRLARIQPELGVRNIWRAGLSPEWPLLVTVLDEATTGLALDARKGDREAEGYVREIRHYLAEITRKGRSVGMFTIIAVQIATGDGVPTLIRDNIPLALSFAAKTTDKSVAALGEQIRQYPSMDPTTLLGDEYRGCLTASLRTGTDPFTVLRYPEITEAEAEAAAAAIVGRVPELVKRAPIDELHGPIEAETAPLTR